MTYTDLLTKNEFISEFSKALDLELESEGEAVDLLWEAFESFQINSQFYGLTPIKDFVIRYTAGTHL